MWHKTQQWTKSTETQCMMLTSSAANLRTAVKGVVSGTLNLQYTNNTIIVQMSPHCSNEMYSPQSSLLVRLHSLLSQNTNKHTACAINALNLRDDVDIEREIKCLFVRCNILMSRFKYCTLSVKLKLFQSYCICFLIQLFGIRTIKLH